MKLTLHALRPTIRRRKRKILGRGNAAGQGTYAGRGIKGQHARSGRSHPPGFEGGRSSIIMQTPKARGKGFKPRHPAAEPIHLERLNVFKDGDIVTSEALRSKGLARTSRLKILDRGALQRKLVVRVPVSARVREKIEQAGGSVSSAGKRIMSQEL